MSVIDGKDRSQSPTGLKKFLFIVLVITLLAPIIGAYLDTDPLNVRPFARYAKTALKNENFKSYIVFHLVDDGYEALKLAQYYRDIGDEKRAAQVANYGQYLMKNANYQDKDVMRELEAIK
jgi:hypothetical protein